MNKFNKELANAIKEVRIKRGLKQKDVVAKYEAVSGQSLSESQLSMWENGKGRMYVDQLHFLCLAMDVSPITLIPHNETEKKKVHRLQDEIECLPKDILDVFYFSVTRWYGNTKALWKFIGLFVSLPPKARQSIAEVSIAFYEISRKSKELSTYAPPVDITYIREQTKKLWQ